jgi:hypothetical protein
MSARITLLSRFTFLFVSGYLFVAYHANAATTVSVEYTKTTGPFTGFSSYAMTINGSSDATVLYDLVLSFSVPPTQITVPSDWRYIQNGTSVEVFSTEVGVPPFGADIPSGGSLTGFTFLLPTTMNLISFKAILRPASGPMQKLIVAGVAREAPAPVFGDLNADGVANCSDLRIVKQSFGRYFGQAGFDPRADVNLDGVVDVRDLASISQRLPLGTQCP